MGPCAQIHCWGAGGFLIMGQSAKTFRERFDERYEVTSDGCWKWTGSIDSTGSMRIHDNIGAGRYKNMTAYLASWLLHVGEPPPGTIIAPKCGNKLCVNWEHLHITTRSARTGRPRECLFYRLASNMVVVDSGCWEWAGRRDKAGYGQFKWQPPNRDKRTPTGAHRAAYWLLVGDIPDDMTVDHICRNTKCCYPRHLRLLPLSENSGYTNRHKTHCKRNHELSGDNLYINKKGARVCKECRRLAVKRWSNKHKKVSN